MKELVVQTWDEFKNLISSKSFKIQCVFNGSRYTIVAPEQSILWSIELRIGTHDSEINDYLTNYAPFANQTIQKFDDFGNPVVSSTFEDVMGLYPKKKMYKHSVSPGQINIFDIEVTHEKRINGGEYWIDSSGVVNVHDDDYVEFSIIDKNDVLGMFILVCRNCGYVRTPEEVQSVCPVCKANDRLQKDLGDILELCKFVLTDYIKKGDPQSGYYTQLYEGVKGTNLVYAGLFTRAMVESFGTEPYTLLARYFYYE